MKSEERPNAWKQNGHLLCVSLKYNIMIREYETFFKSFLGNEFKSDIDIFNESMQAVDPFHLKCPNCRANGKCRQFSEYSRMMVSFEKNAVITHHLTITRVKCDSCKHTHAILPSILIPKCIYSLVFILTVLRTYFQKQLQIQQICELYEIPHSTLYIWIGMLKRHKTFWLGILKDLDTTVLDFICELFDFERLEQKLKSFYIYNGCSFLQKTTVFDSA